MKLRPISKIACLLVSPVVLTVIAATYAQNQHPILDQVANKVIQKYQTSSCQQLWAEKAQKATPSPQEQKAIEFLKGDPLSLPPANVPLSRVIKLRREDEDGEDTAEGLHA